MGLEIRGRKLRPGVTFFAKGFDFRPADWNHSEIQVRRGDPPTSGRDHPARARMVRSKVMRKLFFAALVAVLPLTGFAQPNQPVSPAHEALAQFGLSPDQFLIIGAGVVGGAIGVYALLGGGVWTVAGGVAGALMGDWWFVQRADQAGPRKLSTASLVVRP